MDETIQVCGACEAVAGGDDNYCRNCGTPLGSSERLPATIDTPRQLARRERAPMPAPVKRAAAAVAIGTVLPVVVKIASNALVREAGKQALSAAVRRSNGKQQKRDQPVRPVATKQPAPYEGAVAVSETFMVRRVWVRRD